MSNPPGTPAAAQDVPVPLGVAAANPPWRRERPVR